MALSCVGLLRYKYASLYASEVHIYTFNIHAKLVKTIIPPACHKTPVSCSWRCAPADTSIRLQHQQASCKHDTTRVTMLPSVLPSDSTSKSSIRYCITGRGASRNVVSTAPNPQYQNCSISIMGVVEAND